MTSLNKNFWAFLTLIIGIVTSSSAAWAGPGGPTLGELLLNTMDSFSTIPTLLSAFSYIAGIFLCVVAIYKLKDHVDNPAQHPMSGALKRFIAGGMFLSLPFMVSVVQGSIYDGTVGDNTIANSSSLDPGGLDPNGLDTMIVNFMQDIAFPFQYLFSGFVYILAIGWLIVGINRLTKGMDQHHRGPAGIGTLMTFITSGVLFAWGDIAGSFVNSIFDNGAIASSAAHIDPNDTLGLASSGADFSINQVIQAVMLFVAFVGMIAFVRGWLVLRAFADGQQGATLAQGLTFLVGGTLAINLGDLVNALQSTLGVNGITFT